MKNISGLLIVLAACATFISQQAAGDVVFEETTSQSGMPMGGGGMKTKVLISGDKYRAQKKLVVDKDAMAGQMKFQQQMGGVNMGMMNQINRGGHPNYPDHIMTLDEWGQFDENKQLMDEAAKNVESSSGFGGLAGQLKSIQGVGGLFGKKTMKNLRLPLTTYSRNTATSSTWVSLRKGRTIWRPSWRRAAA